MRSLDPPCRLPIEGSGAVGPARSRGRAPRSSSATWSSQRSRYASTAEKPITTVLAPRLHLEHDLATEPTSGVLPLVAGTRRIGSRSAGSGRWSVVGRTRAPPLSRASVPLQSDRGEGGNVAEAVVVVCDECGKPDAMSITIRAGERNYVKDLCSVHLAALLKDTRAPRRGRPRASGSSSAGRSKPPAPQRRRGRSTTKATGARKGSARKKTTATRR
jgi:hypothetical protein